MWHLKTHCERSRLPSTLGTITSSWTRSSPETATVWSYMTILSTGLRTGPAWWRMCAPLWQHGPCGHSSQPAPRRRCRMHVRARSCIRPAQHLNMQDHLLAGVCAAMRRFQRTHLQTFPAQSLQSAAIGSSVALQNMTAPLRWITAICHHTRTSYYPTSRCKDLEGAWQSASLTSGLCR